MKLKHFNIVNSNGDVIHRCLTKKQLMQLFSNKHYAYFTPKRFHMVSKECKLVFCSEEEVLKYINEANNNKSDISPVFPKELLNDWDKTTRDFKLFYRRIRAKCK